MSELRTGKNHKQIKRTCAGCGKTQWAQVVNPQNGGRPRYKRCHPCAIKYAYSSGKAKRLSGELSTRWQGGVRVSRGYMSLWIPRSSQWYTMADGNSYIYEHRLVMAKHLGRLLKSSEIVHHINGDKLDNRIENLLLVNSRKHHAYEHGQILQRRIRELEQRIRELEDTGNSFFDKSCENNTTREEE